MSRVAKRRTMLHKAGQPVFVEAGQEFPEWAVVDDALVEGGDPEPEQVDEVDPSGSVGGQPDSFVGFETLANVPDIQTWIIEPLELADRQARAQHALDAEMAGKQRAGVISAAEEVLGTGGTA